MEKHFKVLRIVGRVYKVMGIIMAVVTLLSALGFCGMSVLGGSAMESALKNLPVNTLGQGQGFGLLGGVVGGVLLSLAIILSGGIYAVTTYALGEAVYLLIALEENTRRTALLLHSQHEHREALVPPPQA
ncbi:MAG: hypothetical protein Q8O57_02900 [Kiritimatiellota bacterium]|nr:hypothetical protein [Kiritimatiellota bacterium]